MFLTAYNLSHFLMSKGLLTARSLVDGDFSVSEAGRRNRNFKVRRGQQPGFFIKQVKVLDQQATTTLQREAAFYRAVHQDPKYAALRNMMPQFVDYEPRRHAVTLALTDNAESLAEKQQREGVYEPGVLAQLGSALATVHMHGPAMAADPATRGMFPYQVPWTFHLEQSGFNFVEAMGAIGPRLGPAIREFPALQPRLSALRSSWSCDCLIHGDMKFDNCLYRSGQLVVVDWELADIGDGAWDIASIFKDLICACLLTSRGMDTVQPAMRALWQAYRETRHMPLNELAFLDKCVAYTAPRMILAVLEYLWNSPQMTPLGTSMLQTANFILESPQVARFQMLGY